MIFILQMMLLKRKNVKAVKEILDQVRCKSLVQLAKASKALTFDKSNEIIFLKTAQV